MENDFCESVLSGIVANLLYTVILIWLVQKIRCYIILSRHFHNKSFNVYWKRSPENAVHKITTKVKGNTILFEGVKTESDDIFEGKILMNPINLRIGEGYHTHKTTDGFAFIKVIKVNNDKLYVEAPYTGVKTEKDKKIGIRVYQAFVWQKI